MMLKLIHPHPALRRIIFVLLLMLASELSGLYWPEISQAIAQATTYHPERYSVLAFDQPLALPAHVSAGASASFSFHITNHESNLTRYHYRIVQASPTTTKVIKDGYVELPDSAQASQTVDFRVIQPKVVSEYTIYLVGRPEHISFRTQS